MNTYTNKELDAIQRRNLEELKSLIKRHIYDYKREYINAAALPEKYAVLKRRTIETAVASFIEGVGLAAFWGYSFDAGFDAVQEIFDLFEDLEVENDFINFNTITGLALR